MDLDPNRLNLHSSGNQLSYNPAIPYHGVNQLNADALNPNFSGNFMSWNLNPILQPVNPMLQSVNPM